MTDADINCEGMELHSRIERSFLEADSVQSVEVSTLMIADAEWVKVWIEPMLDGKCSAVSTQGIPVKLSDWEHPGDARLDSANGPADRLVYWFRTRVRDWFRASPHDSRQGFNILPVRAEVLTAQALAEHFCCVYEASRPLYASVRGAR